MTQNAWGDLAVGWGGTIVSGGGGGSGSVTVENYAPSPGTPLLPTTPIEFDVIVTGGTLVAVVVLVLYPGTGAQEVAFDRDGFGINFSTLGNFVGSSITPILNGLHFTLRRRGGWYATPVIKVEGGDSNGNPINQP